MVPLVLINAFRRIRGFSTLANLFGLSVGIATSLMILLFVLNELSFDQFHEKASKIYAIHANMKFGGNEMTAKKMSVQFGPVLKEATEDVSDFVRLKFSKRVTISSDRQNIFYEDGFVFADPTIFKLFSFKLLQGNIETVLTTPNSVLITPRIARKYFGDGPYLGKTLVYDGKLEFLVEGIVQPAPMNSTIQYDLIGAFSSLRTVERVAANSSLLDIPYEASHVGAGAYETFVLLASDNPRAKERVEQVLPVLVKSSGISIANSDYYLEPLTALRDDISIIDKYKSILLSVSFLILMLAILNFVSLSAVKSIQRAKEVGVKKTFGAQRGHLRFQLYFETSVAVLMAFVVALVWIELLRGNILNFLGMSMAPGLVYDPLTICSYLGIFIFTVVIAGLYPSMIFSSIRPVDAFKGKIIPQGGAGGFQKYFIAFQFCITVILISCTLVVFKQIDYLRNKELGLDKSFIVGIPMTDNFADKYNSFKNEIVNVADVQDVAAASIPLFKSYVGCYTVKSIQDKTDITLCSMSFSDRFIDMFGLEWSLKPDNASDLYQQDNVILNEEAAQKLQLGEDPMNKTFRVTNRQYTVVGILKNFNYSSLHKSIEPLMMTIVKDTINSFASSGGALYLKFSDAINLRPAIELVGASLKKHIPDQPFEFYFLDQALEDLYQSDIRITRLFTISTAIALLLSCLGLFSFCSYVVQRRLKEIGIRKSLGASTLEIIKILLFHFMSPVLLSMVVGLPIAWYLMDIWLQKYIYRTTLTINFFIVAAFLSIGIAIITVLFKSLRAATSNPVKTIRNNSQG